MRLIDKDALLSDIERTIEKSGCVNHEGEIMDCVRYASEVDAVPVVRCKECGHYDTTGFPALNPGTGWCDKMGKGVHDDFYCSYGERKESEGST
jgi:hypothetical protein